MPPETLTGTRPSSPAETVASRSRRKFWQGYRPSIWVDKLGEGQTCLKAQGRLSALQTICRREVGLYWLAACLLILPCLEESHLCPASSRHLPSLAVLALHLSYPWLEDPAHQNYLVYQVQLLLPLLLLARGDRVCCSRK